MNLLLTFAPRSWFSNLKLFDALVVIDTGIVPLGMYLSERAAADFYFVFFLIIVFASVSRYRGLFENAKEGIVISRNPPLQIADVNREVEQLTGYQENELL